MFSHVFFITLEDKSTIQVKHSVFMQMIFTKEMFVFLSADHNVSSTDKLQSGLEDEDVSDVDEVTGVVHQQP